ncbi:MAG: DCC1-like thiol-disulfide oxidoreductase family protein, partial [Candidatus Latescibacterota bacterium]
EINLYRGQAGAELVRWLDVSRLAEREIPLGLSRREVLARFHVICNDGSIKTGAAAFVALWTVLPKFQRVARMVNNPPLLFLLEIGYTLFLRFRPLLQRLTLTLKCRLNDRSRR